MIGERLVSAFGETKNISAWARDGRCAVSYKTLYTRLAHLGWLPELAITTPRQRLDDPVDRRHTWHTEAGRRERELARLRHERDPEWFDAGF